MLHCDAYYPDIKANGRLLFACMDFVQVGDIELEYAQNSEKYKSENCGYITYAKNAIEKGITLKFEGTCESIQKLAEYLKYGEIAFGGIWTGTGYEPTPHTGVYCYVNGDATTSLISKHCDMMSIEIPVIIRDTDTALPTGVLMLDGIYQFQFGSELIALSDCEYIGNGEYVCKKEINFSYGTTEALFLGVATAPTDFTYNPRVGVKSEDDAEYTITNVNLTDDGTKGTMVPLPTGELDCYVDIRNPIADYVKPFRTYFHIGRSDQ